MKKFLTTVIMLYLTVIDGDSVVYGKKEFRLFGIDAPEYHQKCVDKNGKEYACGIEAYKYLQKLAKEPVECEILTYDRYKRAIGICGDINQKMVLSGNAVSYYSGKYQPQEEIAKQNKKGIWQGRFMRPEFYRALKRGK